MRTRSQKRQALSLYARLVRAADHVGHALHAPLAESGLTVSQFGVLEALKHKGDLAIGELAETILKTSGNLTTVVDNLERDGLVRRRRSETDRRRVVVSLTREGRLRIEAIFPGHGTQAAQLMSVLTSEEQRQLAGLLRKLYRNR